MSCLFEVKLCSILLKNFYSVAENYEIELFLSLSYIFVILRLLPKIIKIVSLKLSSFIFYLPARIKKQEDIKQIQWTQKKPQIILFISTILPITHLVKIIRTTMKKVKNDIFYRILLINTNERICIYNPKRAIFLIFIL